MKSLDELIDEFNHKIEEPVFPKEPKNLYQPANYILQLGGKRIRPVLCLMGHDLFRPITAQVFHAAKALEVFHNFTLVHDDIMDEAPLRRGKSTVHKKYGSSVAILSGDVMLVQAYDELNKVHTNQKDRLFDIFTQTAREVCEGQQLDLDLEDLDLEDLKMADYLHMISLKTSVLLAASLQIGALIGGADEESLTHIYSFGKNVGLAFQIQDDYLDAFGNTEKFGKQIGGDILANKKTFLLIKAFELGNEQQKNTILSLLEEQNPKEKISGMLTLYGECGVQKWAEEKKQGYIQQAKADISRVKVAEERKEELKKLMHRLFNREN